MLIKNTNIRKIAKVTIFFSMIFCLIVTSKNAFAAEHAVGFSIGGAISQLRGEQDTLYKYNSSNNFLYEDDQSVTASFKRSLNYSLEYQSRFDKFILGANINTNNPNYRGYLEDHEFTRRARIKIITNFVDISFEGLYNLTKVGNFSLYGGGALGFGFMHIAQNSTWYVLKDSTHNNQFYFIPKLVLYGEYKIYKNIYLFSKASFTPKLLADNIVYKVNPQYVKDQDRVIKSTLTVFNLTSFNYNFGVMYSF